MGQLHTWNKSYKKLERQHHKKENCIFHAMRISPGNVYYFRSVFWQIERSHLDAFIARLPDHLVFGWYAHTDWTNKVQQNSYRALECYTVTSWLYIATTDNTTYELPPLLNCCHKPDTLDSIEQCFTSPPTQYRLYGRQFLQSKDPTNSIKVLKENQQRKNKQRKQQNTHMHI